MNFGEAKSLNDILTLEGGQSSGHDLVEDVVRTLQSLLGDDTSLLQQVLRFEQMKQLALMIMIE